MFGFVKKKTPDIEQLLTKIDAAIARLPANVQAIGAPLLAQLASAIKTKWKEEHKKNYTDQIKEGETHEAFIYNFLVQTVGDKLESGQYHIYRGTLNAQGHLYKQLFEHAINTMIDLDGYTKQWADTNLRAAVYKGIKEMG